MEAATLRLWIRRGWMQARKVAVEARWIIWADAGELERLRRLRARSNEPGTAYPAALLKPTRRGTN
jgi:hypothetical protein